MTLALCLLLPVIVRAEERIDYYTLFQEAKEAGDEARMEIDNYGNITVTSPVNDADAKKLLGADMVTMEFKKV